MTTYSTPENFKFPILEWDETEKLWILVEDYIFCFIDNGIPTRYHIPKGTKYDKASVPRPLWGIARTDGEWEASSLLHDFTYRYCQRGGGGFPAGSYQIKKNGEWLDVKSISRSKADNMLEYVGLLGGATKLEAATYKWAVKLAPENWNKGF